MAKYFIALLTLAAVYAAEAQYRYDGSWNGYDYDCCRHRRPNFCYPSLVKPFPYYYRCVNRRVVYGRCGVNQCVTMYGSCGQCRDRCSYTSGVYSYYSSYFSGRYYYQCSRGSMYYRSCGLNQSYYPGLGRCGCRESYCERYSGWQATVCNGCGGYVFCRYGRPIRYRRCPWNRRHYDCHRHRCVSRCNGCCGRR
ncbi:hypothetical protein NP493_1720g00038 [Ridgeia piscesae]|uniref:Uncharacterized protein n=1 Tax=Ridgeia piscesae TaxID=27915 RepID=A0AAD9JV79_RIDPI|nr:hypothetical protein NP493_1720g00038 [Ridgeia piscesae]